MNHLEMIEKIVIQQDKIFRSETAGTSNCLPVSMEKL